MADNDDNKRRRLVELKDGCRYGKFGKTKAYELIAQERIRAYKMGGKTLIDLDSIDEYHASLPRVESTVCRIFHGSKQFPGDHVSRQTSKSVGLRLWLRYPDRCLLRLQPSFS
jgi:excisionase family DNA binding protein